MNNESLVNKLRNLAPTCRGQAEIYIEKAADEIERMDAENAELRKDAERLDWIDTLSSSGFGELRLNDLAYGDYRYYVHGKGYRKVREVVDEAMSKKPK